MNRFETAEIYLLLSDPDQLKMIKMTCHHGAMSVQDFMEALDLPENAVLSKVAALVNGGLFLSVKGGYDCDCRKLEEALNFFSSHCCGHHEEEEEGHCCGGHDHEEGHSCCCGHHHES